MPVSPRFLFTTCQVGAESALKQELARVWPAFRFAYSRPGFLTFKLPAGAEPPDDLDLQCTFARAHGLSLGKISVAQPSGGPSPKGVEPGTIESTQSGEIPRRVWELIGDLPVERLHV